MIELVVLFFGVVFLYNNISQEILDIHFFFINTI